ncbi:MAG: GTP-binding protein, partial [Anaeroplasmataceae bacterium]|nr:GTP-binding protein [Anaeroplasmataceae bacterium]
MKIDIISGFLGAGKTTFIKRLLNTKLKNEKVVLIENEFGEVSVDSDFLADSKIDIKELSQGCICCSLFGDFSKSLNEVVDKFHPDRILIEPSGVGKLSDIIQAVADAHLEKNLNALVCMVDVSKAKIYSKNFGEFFLDQIKAAHTVILSRTDVAKEEKVTEALEIIREYNHDAVLVTTPITSLTDEELCKAYEGIHDNFLHELMESLEHEHHHHHHDDEECECGHHHHHDDEECECGHHHHHDDE